MTTLAAEQTAVASIYRLAARVLGAELDAAALQSLRGLTGQLPNRLGDPPPWEVLHTSADEALTTITVEFYRLFVGPRPVVRACPDADGRVSRSAGATMRPTFADGGQSLTGTSRIPADHLAVWLSILANAHAELAWCTPASSDVMSVLRRVAAPPIADWLEETLSVVAREARTWPYRPVARATLAALEMTRAQCGVAHPTAI